MYKIMVTTIHTVAAGSSDGGISTAIDVTIIDFSMKPTADKALSAIKEQGVLNNGKLRQTALALY